MSVNGVYYITEAALDAMHLQYQVKARAYEELAATSAYIIGVLTWQLALQRGKAKDYDTLLARVNEQEGAFQNVLAWRDENEHLWQVIAALDRELRERE